MNALALAAFVLVHLGNHLALLTSFEAHIAVMEGLRWVCRAQLLEPILLLLFAGQIILGVALLWQRGRPKGGWAVAQAVSGLYLAFFVINHVSAAIAARSGALALDTNVFWAASVVSRPPFVWGFAPYYVLAFVALFTHIAAALRFRIWPMPATRFQVALPFVGIVLGLVVVGGLMRGAADGLPPPYVTYLERFALR